MENLLERNVEKRFGSNRGASLASALVGLIIGIILSVGVAIPITQATVTDANLTGVSATVVGFLPVFVALIPMMLCVAFF